MSKDPLETFHSRLGWLFVFVLFFPTILTALNATNEDILKWCLVISAIILCYVVVEVTTKKIRPWVITWSNILILLQMATYAYITYAFGSIALGRTLGSQTIILVSSIYTIIFGPVLVLILLVINFTFETIKIMIPIRK